MCMQVCRLEMIVKVKVRSKVQGHGNLFMTRLPGGAGAGLMCLNNTIITTHVGTYASKSFMLVVVLSILQIRVLP